jgi:DNA gyrase inhibitor GyrI
MPDNNDNRSFGLLFRYIQGDNQQRQKIEMTSPVLMENSADGPTMAFIVPVETAEKGTPAPNNVAVTNDTINAGHFAAMTFPGRRSQATEKQALETIMTWISEKKFEPSGEILFAYYDPPWTPIPLRRNEVLIRIAPPKPN